MMAEKCDKYTRFERARMIGARALQISMGAPPTVNSENKNPIRIAEDEYNQCKSPLDVRRRLPNKMTEKPAESI